MIFYDIVVGAVFCIFGFLLTFLNRNRQTPLARGQVWIGRGMMVAGALLPILTALLTKK